jgi:DNA-binding Lrp family transcriptional regulator
MDELTNNILSLLRQNARRSNAEIAGLLNVSESDVEQVINDLVSQGVICQFTTIVNDNDLKGHPIKALVELSISPEKGTGYDSIAKRIYEYPNVVSHYLVSGKYDFLVVVQGADHKDIAHFVFDKLATLENVKSTTTHFIFKSYKEHGVLLTKSDLNNRVPIMP